jgi:tetratricopeptide (TPR) repeat protein
MEAIYGRQDEEMAVQLAHHYFQAGEDRPALHYSIIAARRAARLYAGDETVQHASRAIAIATRIGGDRHVLIGLYRDRGLAYEWSGDFGRAYDDLDKARQIARDEQEGRCECEALIDLGKLWASKDYRQSLHYFAQALDQARALGDPVVLAASLNWMGNWYANAEEPNEAIAYHHEALQLLQEGDNRPELGHTLDLLGIASLLAADTRGSKSYFDQAIAHFRELGDRAALASSLTGRGNCGGGTLATVPRAMKPDVARHDFEEAIQIAREIRAPGAEAWADWSLAFVELILGRFGTALALAEHGLQVATAIGHREWIVANRAALGVLYGEMFAFEEAQRHSQAALALAHELQSQHWINQTGGTLAALYLLQDDKSQAEQALAAVISPQTPMDTLHRRGCWARRAELALAQGDPERAAIIVDGLIQTAPHPLPGDVIPYLWLLQGKAQTALGKLAPALSWLRAAAEAARQGDERFLLWQIHGALAALYVKMDDLAAATQARSLAEALIGELAATLSDKHRQQTYLTRAGSKLPLLP